jgi:hypothetical protein
MTNLSLIVAAILSLASARPALADDGSYCVDLARLAPQVKDCQQNDFWVIAAAACEEKLEKDIATQQSLLSTAMALESLKDAVASQTGRIQNTNTDLSGMVATLEDLESKARHVRAEMQVYGQNFVYAGPIPKAFAERTGLDQLFRKFHCFADNQRNLAGEMAQVTKHIAELEKAKNAATQFAAINKINLQKMDASSLNAVAKGVSTTRAPASVGAGVGKNNNGASSITGTEKAQQDDEALKNLKQ